MSPLTDQLQLHLNLQHQYTWRVDKYAICLISNSTKYSVYISRVGEMTCGDAYISNQPTLGSYSSPKMLLLGSKSMGRSQIHHVQADFTDLELLIFIIQTFLENVAKLMENPLNVSSNTIRVGLGTTVVMIVMFWVIHSSKGPVQIKLLQELSLVLLQLL